MTSRPMLVGMAILMWLLVGSHSYADFMYQLADSTGTPTSTFTIGSVGGTVDVRVYLREFGSPGDILQTDGLFSAGVGITFDTPGGIAGVQAISDIFPNSAFINLIPPPTVTATDAGFTGDVDFNPFLTPDTDNRIFLGTFRFTGLAAGTVTIAARDRDTSTDDTLTGQGAVLDSLIGDAAGTITVAGAAVPEPPAWLLSFLGLLLAPLCWRQQAILTQGKL